MHETNSMGGSLKGRWTNEMRAENVCDSNGNPTGGNVRGVGLSIDWQNGPLGRGAEKIAASGAFVEDIVLAAIQRLQFFQESKFKCRENALALTHLEDALHWLEHRHDAREARQVQGLHKP